MVKESEKSTSKTLPTCKHLYGSSSSVRISDGRRAKSLKKDGQGALVIQLMEQEYLHPDILHTGNVLKVKVAPEIYPQELMCTVMAGSWEKSSTGETLYFTKVSEEPQSSDRGKPRSRNDNRTF